MCVILACLCAHMYCVCLGRLCMCHISSVCALCLRGCLHGFAGPWWFFSLSVCRCGRPRLVQGWRLSADLAFERSLVSWFLVVPRSLRRRPINPWVTWGRWHRRPGYPRVCCRHVLLSTRLIKERLCALRHWTLAHERSRLIVEIHTLHFSHDSRTSATFVRLFHKISASQTIQMAARCQPTEDGYRAATSKTHSRRPRTLG